MREYDWLQYDLTWFEKDSDYLVGEDVLIWPSKPVLIKYGVIAASQDCIEGEMPVLPEHLDWLKPISPVDIDLARYDYFIGVHGCWANP